MVGAEYLPVCENTRVSRPFNTLNSSWEGRTLSPSYLVAPRLRRGQGHFPTANFSLSRVYGSVYFYTAIGIADLGQRRLG